MTSRSQWLLIVITLALAVSNSLSLYQGYTLRRAFEEHLSADTFLVRQRVPNFEVRTLDGQSVDLLEKVSSRALVLIFLSADDCHLCLPELRALTLAVEKFRQEDCRVVGIFKGDAATATPFMEENGLTFPIFLDPTASLWEKFGIKVTPLKLLLDDKRNIVLIDFPNKDPWRQEQFVDSLIGLVQMRL